jgi:hypothetical protein
LGVVLFDREKDDVYFARHEDEDVQKDQVQTYRFLSEHERFSQINMSLTTSLTYAEVQVDARTGAVVQIDADPKSKSKPKPLAQTALAAVGDAYVPAAAVEETALQSVTPSSTLAAGVGSHSSGQSNILRRKVTFGIVQEEEAAIDVNAVTNEDYATATEQMLADATSKAQHRLRRKK